MTKYTVANKAMPFVVIVLVIACVWYALDSRPTSQLTPSATATASSSADSSSTVANASVIPAIDTTVQKVGTNVHFSVPSVPLKNIQKVEFYVESQFVGTAYDAPYSVVVSENTLAAGTHTVTAKIYTDTATTQSKPASFTAKPTVPVEQPIDTSDSDGVAVATAGNQPSAPAPAIPSIEAPYGVEATVGSDSTSATVTWTAPSGAAQYQVLRDNVEVAITTGTGFTDTGLIPGQTYDYQVVAIGSASQTSERSGIAAVTMPVETVGSEPGNTAPGNKTTPPNTAGDDD